MRIMWINWIRWSVVVITTRVHISKRRVDLFLTRLLCSARVARFACNPFRHAFIAQPLAGVKVIPGRHF